MSSKWERAERLRKLYAKCGDWLMESQILEFAEDEIRAEVADLRRQLEGYDAVASEVAKRGTSHLHTGESPLIPAARLLREAREEREESQGEAQRTVYVEADSSEDAISDAVAGFSFRELDAMGLQATHAVRLTARKVSKC